MVAWTPAVTMPTSASPAGVSIATVSRALNGTRPMSEDLRGSASCRPSRLDYRVNLLGRGLRQRRTSSVGLVVPDLDNPFFSALAQHVSRTFGPSGVDIFVYSADGELALERRGIRSFLGRQVDGLVVVPVHEVESADNLALASASVVTVQLDRQVLACPGALRRLRQRQGHGAHRRARAVGGRPVERSRRCSWAPLRIVVRARAAGRLSASAFRDAPRLLGLVQRRVGTAGGRGSCSTQGCATRRRVVAAADTIAVGLLAAGCRPRGARVPEDFRVVGFDGIGVSKLAHPTLTTVRQPIEAMSQAILDLVIHGAEGEMPSARTRLFRPTFVCGESSPEGLEST